MLCTWWVYICGSNASGGEQASLSTKADFACGSSSLPILLACMGLSTGSNLSLSPNTRELHQYQQLNHERVKAMDSQSIPVSFMITRLRFPQQAFCLMSSLSRQYRSSCLCNLLLWADLPMQLFPPPTFEPVRKKKKRLVIYHSVLCCSLLRPLCSPSLWHNGELFLWYDLPGPGLGWGDWGDAHSQGPASALPLPWPCDLHSVKLYQLLFPRVVVIWGQVLHQMFLCCFSVCCQKPLYA